MASADDCGISVGVSIIFSAGGRTVSIGPLSGFEEALRVSATLWCFDEALDASTTAAGVRGGPVGATSLGC